MTNALATPGIGHNLPPLGEQLVEEIAPLHARAQKLVEIGATALIVDDESAAKIIDIAGLMETLEKELEAARETRGRPFLEATRAVNSAYIPLIEQLTTLRLGPMGTDKKRRGGLRGMLETFRQKREAEAEAARQTALAEQRRREEEAEAARRAAELAAVGDGSRLGYELAALKAQEAADYAARRAGAIRPEPVRAHLGSLGTKREIAFDVTDIRKLLGWMIKQPMKGNVEQAVRTIMGAYLRQLGVDAVARGVEIPGLAARVETQAAIRR
jgi:hypothetical protein